MAQVGLARLFQVVSSAHFILKRMRCIGQVKAAREAAGDWRGAFDYQGLQYGTQYNAAYGSWPPQSVEQLICDPTILAVSLQYSFTCVCRPRRVSSALKQQLSRFLLVCRDEARRIVWLCLLCRLLETSTGKSNFLKGCSCTLCAATTDRACIAISIQPAKMAKTFGTLAIVGATLESI